MERNANKNNLSNTGLSNFSSYNTNDYLNSLNTTLISNNNNSIKKGIPLPTNKSIFSNNKSNSNSVNTNNSDNRYNSKSTKNNGNLMSK